MSATRWLEEAAEVNLTTAMDERGLVHVVIDDTGWANCGPTARLEPTPDAKVCMWCRELPGRERHAIELGVTR